MNRDFLKEAIADAKAVKESAIANAKAALEESFTPHLKSMLSTKLQEMEKEDTKENMRGSFEEDDVKEMMRDSYEEDDVKEEARGKNDKISELSNPVMRKGLKGDDPAELETEKMRESEEDLDEVLSELEKSEEVNEDARTDAEEEGYEDGMKDEKEDLEGEAEEIDLDDMTDDDLKKFIEDVIEDMVTAGEIEAGENFEDDVEVDVTVDDEVDVEVEDEVEVTESKEVNESEDVNESVVLGAAAGAAALFAAAGGLTAVTMAMDEDPKGFEEKYPKIFAFLSFMQELGSAASSAKMREAKGDKASEEELEKIEDKMERLFETKDSSMDEEMKKDLDEAYSTIETLRTDLNEINLLNAKLLYTNKIFKSKNLNESDKVKVLTNFDKAATVKEAKLIYETLKDLKPTRVKRSIKESLGRASKPAGLAPKKSEKKPIVESNQMVDRFKKLAGIV